MSERRVNVSEEDWGALLSVLADDALDDDAFDLDEDDSLDELLAPSDEVRNVSRRIAGQYVEILATFAAGAFGRRTDPVSLSRAGTAVDALLRLASAAGDTDQEALLHELLDLIGPATSGPANSRTRQNALAQLRDWLPRFGATLEHEDAERLTKLVQWDRGTVPLLEELRGLTGIGPKRLQRLYSAGLFTIDTVAASDPADVAAVTGIPLNLAEEVVDATRRYASAERMRFLEELREGAVRLRRMLAVVPDDSTEFRTRATSALEEVERTLQTLKVPETP
ncbi:MAG: helix-hairpin-helix domain-containing protein [Myxococcales bacterium]|nr:helix-hairpin-helix domain-containing protein [Myxococcales bacterium]MCB9669628.1 helix-hairpin-helix domain-containing protein [Alphaproteobacteria bacterium]